MSCVGAAGHPIRMQGSLRLGSLSKHAGACGASYYQRPPRCRVRSLIYRILHGAEGVDAHGPERGTPPAVRGRGKGR